MLPNIQNLPHLPDKDTVCCPVCTHPLAFLQISKDPSIPGISGPLILCEVCASLVVAHLVGRALTLVKMTQAEKQALRDHPQAHLYKTIQQGLAQTLGGSD